MDALSIKMANRAYLQDMEIDLRYREGEESQKKSTGMLYLFKVDTYFAGLEDFMACIATPLSHGRKGDEFL